MKKIEDSNYIDITKYWLKNNSNKIIVAKQLKINDKFNYKGRNYVVDGKKVKNEFKSKEVNFANWVQTKTDKIILLNPTINKPDGVSTADLTIDNELYDMKIVTGKSKQLLFHNIYKKNKQANNFLFDATNSDLKYKELINQVDSIYKRKDMFFVNKIGIRKGEKFVIFKRK